MPDNVCLNRKDLTNIRQVFSFIALYSTILIGISFFVLSAATLT
jgi:hypothetical protein